MIKTLTAGQYNVLNKIARRTKMDCWFCIKQDWSGYDYVHDLEEDTKIDLSTGVAGLMEGLDCLENIEQCDLNLIEKTVLYELCNDLQIEIPISLQ